MTDSTFGDATILDECWPTINQKVADRVRVRVKVKVRGRGRVKLRLKLRLRLRLRLGVRVEVRLRLRLRLRLRVRQVPSTSAVRRSTRRSPSCLPSP
jgi:hypothetical protein